MLSPERLEEDEYETQYYGFSSTTFNNDLNYMIKSTIQRDIKDIETTMLEQYPDFPEGEKHELAKEITDFTEHILQKIQQPLGELEETVRDIFKIKPHVCITKPIPVETEYSEEETKKLETEKKDLEQKLIQEKLFQKRLKEHKARQEKIQSLVSLTEKNLHKLEEAKREKKDASKLNDILNFQKKFFRA